MSASCSVSVSVPPKRDSTPIDSVAPTFSPASGGHGARNSRGADCSRPSSPSTTNSESTRPRRRIADVRPAHENDFARRAMNTVSPLLGSLRCGGDHRGASGAVRRRRAGDEVAEAPLEPIAHDRVSRSMPIFATSARERAPTSSHRFSIDVGSSSAARRRHK
jgi:hypothetical protein